MEFQIPIVDVLIVATITCFILTWSIGANDVANAFGTSVGARVLTVRQACLIATVFEFLGSFLMGSHVAETFRNGILHLQYWETEPAELAVGMTAAMTGGFFLVTLATFFALPVSGTHAILGAVMGFAIVSRGIESVNWSAIGFIVIGWLISPLCAGVCSSAMFICLRKFILRANNPFQKGVSFIPICYGVTIALVFGFIIYKGSPGIDLSFIPWWGVVIIMIVVGVVSGAFVKLSTPIIVHWASKKAGFDHELDWSLVNSVRNMFSKTEPAPPAHVEMDQIATDSTLSDSDMKKEYTEQLHQTNSDNGTSEIAKSDSTPIIHEIVNENNNGDEIITLQNYYEDDQPATAVQEAVDVVPIQTQHQQEEQLPEDTTSSEKTGDATENKVVSEEFEPRTEQLFSMGQILMATVGSFAHGANDIANAIGPYALIYSIYQTGSIYSDSPITWWILVLGGVGIVLGLATWGYKVIKTIGENLTKVTPSRGFNIELGSALTVMTASRIGIPLSTTHCKVGAVVGVGLADGSGAINWKMVAQVASGWLITLPIAGAVSAIVFKVCWGLGEYNL